MNQNEGNGPRSEWKEARNPKGTAQGSTNRAWNSPKWSIPLNFWLFHWFFWCHLTQSWFLIWNSKFNTKLFENGQLLSLVFWTRSQVNSLELSFKMVERHSGSFWSFFALSSSGQGVFWEWLRDSCQKAKDSGLGNWLWDKESCCCFCFWFLWDDFWGSYSLKESRGKWPESLRRFSRGEQLPLNWNC